MIRISREQAFARWDTLPQVLCDALFAEETTDFIWKTCQDEHIPEAKIYTIARLAGYVMFGFLHPEDLAAEIRDALKIDIRIATAIANAISQRIFAPIRPQIDAIYRPVGASVSSIAVGFGPKILEEIRPVVPVGARPVSGPAFPRVDATGVVPPRPPIFGNLQKTESGKIQLPSRPVQTVSGIQPPSSNVSVGGKSEFSRIAGAGATSPGLPSEKGGVPALVPPPMPVFVASDSALRPLSKVPDFMTKSTDKFASLTSKPPTPPAKPAVIEFGIPKPPVQRPVTPPLPVPQPPAPPMPPGK